MEHAAGPGIEILGIPLEFLLFPLMLVGVALFHRRTLEVAASGLAVIVLYKLALTGFHGVPGLAGLGAHLREEWVVLANLFGLLMGFALLSRHFEESRVPDRLPDLLPDDWRGGFVLLVLVFVLSSFLDNIAAALIGGTVAATVYRHKVHIGYIAALVAASNAGGSGSVVGDTTTTMMWIDGVSPLDVLHAYVAAGVALVVFGIPASLQQQRYSPLVKDAPKGESIDWLRVGVGALPPPVHRCRRTTVSPWVGETRRARPPPCTEAPGTQRPVAGSSHSLRSEPVASRRSSSTRALRST